MAAGFFGRDFLFSFPAIVAIIAGILLILLYKGIARMYGVLIIVMSVFLGAFSFMYQQNTGRLFSVLEIVHSICPLALSGYGVLHLLHSHQYKKENNDDLFLLEISKNSMLLGIVVFFLG